MPRKSLALHRFEAEYPAGFSNLCIDEISEAYHGRLEKHPARREGEIIFDWRGAFDPLYTLRHASAIYYLMTFPVQRPRGLLSGGHLEEAATAIDWLQSLRPSTPFHALRISAAGRESSDMKRVAERLSAVSKLKLDETEGDCVVRIRPSAVEKNSWDLLIRITPRPLSVRPWRVANFPGALDGVLASGIVELLRPRPNDRFLNLMCGSGTLLIERLRHGPVKRCVGVENGAHALSACRKNLHAARLDSAVEILEEDATQCSLPDRSFDAIAVDLPWGEQVRSPVALATLHRECIRTIGRLLASGGRAAVITQRGNLLREALTGAEGAGLAVSRVIKTTQGGFSPEVFLLRSGNEQRRGENSSKSKSPEQKAKRAPKKPGFQARRRKLSGRKT